MDSRPLRLVSILAFCALLYGSNVLAQCYLWYGDKWSGNSVTYHINSGLATSFATQEDYENAIDSAVSQWNRAGANFRFDKGPDVNYEANAEPDGVYQLGYFIDANTDTLAYTNVSNQGFVITKVETYFNQYFEFSASPNNSQYDIWSDAVHELGHWLNLQTETNISCSQNVMYEYYAAGNSSHRYLTDDDKAGIAYIYGVSAVGVEDNIFVYDGPTTITQNAEPSYFFNFEDEYPYGDYLVSSSGSLLIEHGEGEYVAATSDVAYPSSNGGWYFQFDFGTLPYGYYWHRNMSGNVLGRVKITGTEQDGTILVTYYNIAVSGVPSNTTSGSLSHNETWGDQNILTGSVTVPTGDTLKILPGSTVKFPSGGSLTVNGKLIANGAYVDPITFTSNGSTSPGAWGSILLNGSGANGSTISYAEIDYGTEVKINQSDGVTIESCNIMDNSYHGIEVYYGSNFLAQGNTIANSNVNHGITITGGSNNNCNYNTIYKYPNVSPGYHNGAGIQYGASSGNVKQNDIDYYNWGIGAIWGASVNSYYSIDNTTRNNRVTNCLYGLMVYRNSYCDFGLQSAQTAYSYNSIYNNADYNVAVGMSYPTYASGVYAGNDWWGSNPPDGSKFYVSSSSYGDFVPYLSSDPWSGYSLPSESQRPTGRGVDIADATSRASNPTDEVQSPSFPTVLQDSVLIGMQLIGQNKRKDAKDYFLSFINRHPDNQAAYVELYSCADSSTMPDILSFFKSNHPQGPTIQKLLLANLYLDEGNASSATQVDDETIIKNLNTSLAAEAELNNFYIDLNVNNDPTGASQILTHVEGESNLLEGMELSDAESALKFYVDPNTGKMPNMRSQQTTFSSQSQVNGLAQNYPNPFNPTTVVSYNLKSAGHVTLKVYDVLGREVMTLVDGYQNAGVHSADFNGANLASGVYFYRLTAPGISQIKKMILLK